MAQRSAPSVAPAESTAESPLLREPTNPDETLNAVLFLVDLGREEMARPYLQRLLDQDLDTKILHELRKKYGAPRLLSLTRVEALKPLAMQWYLETAEATRAYYRDPQRIEGLIRQLSASPDERAWAITELQKAAAAAVPHLLHVLQDPTRAAEKSNVVLALGHLTSDAVPPLIGALESDDLALRAAVISALGRIGDPRAAPFLLGFAAGPAAEEPQALWAREALAQIAGRSIGSSDEAVQRLRALGEGYYRRAATLSPATDSASVELWTWNNTEKVPVSRELTEREAAYELGLRFARQGLVLSPDDTELQVLLMSLMLESEISKAGWDHPLPRGPGTAYDLALARGTELVAAVLRRALTDRRTPVALAATRLLADLNAENQLHAEGWRSGLLLQTVDYPDRRVQIAATKAVLDLQPSTPFAGSSRILSVLGRAVGIEERPKVLVADVRADRGRDLAALFGQLGYSVELATSGREAVNVAAESAAYDLICIEARILNYGMSDTIANLRADSRTAGLPIVLVAPLELEPALSHLLSHEPDVTLIVRPLDSAGLRLQLDPFLADRESKILTTAERAAYRDFAYDWLLRMANGELPTFDPLQAERALQRALSNPILAPKAAEVLGLSRQGPEPPIPPPSRDTRSEHRPVRPAAGQSRTVSQRRRSPQ